MQEVDDFFGIGCFTHPLYAHINVFGVFTENDHIDLAWVFHWRWHTVEILYRPHTLVQIQFLTDGHVQRADATTHRRGHRAFDRHFVVLYRLQGFIGQPHIVAINARGFFACKNLHPTDFLLALISFGHRSINHLNHHRRNVYPNAVALDERNDGIVGDGLSWNDFLTFCRHNDMAHLKLLLKE